MNGLLSLQHRAEIEDLLALYAWTIDHEQFDRWTALFEADGTFVHNGREFRGRDTILSLARDTYARMRFLRRFISIPLMELVDDVHAVARTYFQLVGASKNGHEVLASGTYVFHLVRRESWLIARCEAEFDHYTSLDLEHGWAKQEQRPGSAGSPG